MDGVMEQCPWCGHTISRSKFLEIEAKIRTDEQRKLESAKVALRKEIEEKHRRELTAAKQLAEKRATEAAERKIAVITGERNQAAQKVKELEAREAGIKKQAQIEAEGRLQKELARQRQVLEKDRDQALFKERSAFVRERESWEKKIKEMERQLQRKTANELGDGAEIDLFEALRDAFPTDKITRISKGQPGADILQEILYKGQVCGRIIIDSKNHQGWKNGFLTKLRADRASANADHAILSTTVFRSGEKELFVENGVIAVSPARVVHIVELLRTATVRMHTLGLSLRERTGKMSQLYKFMTSMEYGQRFNELGRLADDLLDLDVKEAKAHQDVWKKRGATVTRLKNVIREIDTDVSAILEGTEGQEALPAARAGTSRSLRAS